MPANLNPHTLDLLSWHGHATGGVNVPFRAQGNPLGQLIETALVRRLRALATAIAANADSRPRWVFLVGGPGNGKSETVQDFLGQLDRSLSANGDLVRALRQRFSGPGLLQRRVEILPHDVADCAGFLAKVGRLIVVQDATATESAMGNAAKELADDLLDLVTSPPTRPLPVFVACANRGLLARAMNEAVLAFREQNEVTRLLAQVIQASSLGLETLAERRQCWPLQGDERFACWPLDVESLVDSSDVASPLDRILQHATKLGSWETAGRCLDCASRSLCPFRQNAEWLRSEPIRTNLLMFLRRGELSRGQRWSFRDAFSLVAELLVGQWSDLEPAQHPCEWVHRTCAAATATPPDPDSTLSLGMQLYSNTMFRGGHLRRAASAFLEQRPVDPQSHPLTHKLLAGCAALGTRASSKPIRETLTRGYDRLDPGGSTPRDPAHVLRRIEDAFCQSIEQGRSEFQQTGASPAEDALLSLMEGAEGEWDTLGRESGSAVAAVCLLRKLACMIAKRSAGIRLGHHALDDLLAEYGALLRDATRLAAVRGALQPLLGDVGPRFNLLEIIGQPTAERQPIASLQGSAPGIRLVRAPLATPSTPGHDVPCIEFTNPPYRVPLTFDFFMALRLRKEGCAGSSLPANVRAALDRTRHRFAGTLCHDDEMFADGRASILLATGHRITLPVPGGSPALAPEP